MVATARIGVILPSPQRTTGTYAWELSATSEDTQAAVVVSTM